MQITRICAYHGWFWPPIVPAAEKILVIVSTFWEAASAELDIPGRPA